MQPKQTNYHRLPVRLPPETFQKLEKYAKEKDFSLNFAIIVLLDRALGELDGDMELVPKGELSAILDEIKELIREREWRMKG